MKHLSEKKLIALILDVTDSKSKARVTEHLDICGECRNQYRVISSVFMPNKGINISLSEDLRQRILNSASKVRVSDTNTDNQVAVLSKIRIHKALISGLSAAAGVIIAVLILIPAADERAYLKIAQIYGNADIDALPARTHDIVGSGHTISTGDHSAMILKLSNDHRLILMGRSNLTIENADINRNNFKVKYTLDKGTLLNRHNQYGMPAEYAFDTPHALINAQDADLIVKESGEHSSVMLLNGSMSIKDKKTSSTITVNSPGKYVVADGIVKSDPNDTAAALQKVDDAIEGHEDHYDDETLVSRDYFYNNQSPDADEFMKNRFRKLLVNDVADIITDDESRSPELIPVSGSD